MSTSTNQRPRRVAVLGAGMAGLCAAWFLQEHDVDVTVFDRDGVAAGSSWGNAGWLTPSLAVPLPEPSVLSYGIKAVLSPSSPVYIPPTLNPRLLNFLLRFARNCTHKRWRTAMESLIPLNERALETFDELERGGVEARTEPADPFTAAFRTTEDSRALTDEFEQLRASGQEVSFEVISGEAAREDVPALSHEISTAIRIHDQRFINPGAYVESIADSIRDRGGRILDRHEISSLQARGNGVTVGGERFDALVLATGSWISPLARQVGVRRLVQAGRGYSFTVPVDRVPDQPVYFPTQRIACTPLDGGLRIAGLMEFREASAPLDPRRLRALVAEAGRLFDGAHMGERRNEWVGARPCTSDGLPLVGATTDPRVFLAGGHGMWGITPRSYHGENAGGAGRHRHYSTGPHRVRSPSLTSSP